MEINFMSISNRLPWNLNHRLEQVTFEQTNDISLYSKYHWLADTPVHPHRKSTDNSPNSSFSSTSSSLSPREDEKHPVPFSFDSLQKFSQPPTDINLSQEFIQLDQLYPSIDKHPSSIVNSLDNDDDDLLAAAATACTRMKKDSNWKVSFFFFSSLSLDVCGDRNINGICKVSFLVYLGRLFAYESFRLRYCK